MGNQYVTEWTDERISEGIMRIASIFEPKRMPSNREVVEYEGDYKLANAIQKHGGYAYWANELGLEQKRSETKLGVEGEEFVSEKLKALGYNVKPTSTRHPYDLLIDGCVKVDVKTANTSFVRDYPMHSYRLAKSDHTCDFYIFYEADTDKTYVVPACKLQGQVQVCMGEGSKRFAKYSEAYHLINRMARTLKEM